MALIDFSNKVNTITLGYIFKLGLKICPINFAAQKIDSSTLKMFEIVLASFQIKNKLERARFFQETFLLTNLNIKMVLRMFLLILSNANIKFAKKKLI